MSWTVCSATHITSDVDQNKIIVTVDSDALCVPKTLKTQPLSTMKIIGQLALSAAARRTFCSQATKSFSNALKKHLFIFEFGELVLSLFTQASRLRSLS